MKRSRLIEYRNGRSQATMAALYGVSQQVWSEWENGGWKPNVATMKRLEDDSGISMEDLFPDVFNKQNLLQEQGA